jgi:hypothetical protein
MADERPSSPGAAQLQALKESIKAIVEREGKDVKVDTVMTELKKKTPGASYNRSTVALLLSELVDE